MFLLQIITQKNGQCFTEVLNHLDYAHAVIAVMIAAQKSKDRRVELKEIHLYSEPFANNQNHSNG